MTKNLTEVPMTSECDPDHVAFISALERGKFDLASKILARDTQNKYVHPVGPLQVTALHVAAWQGRIDLLDQLYEKGADVALPDMIGRCALFYAAHCGHVDVTRWILERGGNVHARVGIACSKDIHQFKLMNSCLGFQMLPIPKCSQRTPLHEAVRNNHAEVVRLLVEADADVEAKGEDMITPLLLAGSGVNRNDPQGMERFVEIMKILVSKKWTSNSSRHQFINIIHPHTGTTALHHAAALGSAEATELLLANDAWPMFKSKRTGNTPLHLAASIGSTETLLALLKTLSTRRVNTCDQLNRTALHRAAYQGHRDCVRVLINRGGNLAAVTQTGVTVIDAIFAHIPRPMAFLTEIMDSCVQTNNCTSEKYDSITVDFGILAPNYQMQIKVVQAIIRATSNIAQLGILQHPLVETFLRLKWAKLRTIFFLHVLVHILFVTSLSTYGLSFVYQLDIYNLSRPALAISAAFIFINTISQVFMEPRHYLRQYETWLFLICTALSLGITVVAECAQGGKQCNDIESEIIQTLNTETPSKKCPQWLLHCVSVTILLGWIQMMLLIGRFPMWGYYALMFSAVLKNMLTVLLAFCYLIVGFALSFIILFNGTADFCNIWTAVVRTVVMMMGEYEFHELFKKNHLIYTTKIMFLFFTLLVSIVLINLMIGLAVKDIQTIEKEGHTRRLLKQAEFIAHLERVMSHRIFRRNWLHPSLRIHSSRDIPTKITLSYRENHSHRVNHVEAPRDIPTELKEALFLLATKNFHKNNLKEEEQLEDADALLANFEKQLRKWRARRCTNSAK